MLRNIFLHNYGPEQKQLHLLNQILLGPKLHGWKFSYYNLSTE